MKQKRGISLMTMLLVMGILPLIVSAVIMTVIAANSIESEVRGETFDKLKVASESVSQYFAYDVRSNGDVDYEEYADHDFIESMKSESVELTLFKGDTRFITSLKNENGAYNEGTQASAEVFAEVSRGKEYEADDVVIGGVDYYVFYEPIYDGNGAFWGMAFAGTPQAKVSKAISSATIKLVMIAVISTIIFSIVIVLVASKIKKSIQTIADGLLCLSDGDIAQGIDIKNDIIIEVNDMISATNNLQQKLLEIVGTVKEHTVKLSGSIDVVQLSANQSSQGTGQISGAMDELAHSTMSLSENVQNVNTHAIEMGEYIQGITGNVTALSNASDEIKESTENAQNYMAQVMDCSDNSTASVAEILESIKLTNDSIIKITEAVDLITEITSQTNLLSLNASIEAARAGEAGKGFAVVAEEIGKLATESAKSADTIRGLAEDMKEKSSRTVVLAGKIDDIIKEEKTCVNATQSAFEALGASIEESLAMIAEINTKSAELMVLKENIISNISDLSAISEENAASNQEVTASVQSIAERINEMSSQSDEMKGVSEDLQDAVAYFR